MLTLDWVNCAAVIFTRTCRKKHSSQNLLTQDAHDSLLLGLNLLSPQRGYKPHSVFHSSLSFTTILHIVAYPSPFMSLLRDQTSIISNASNVVLPIYFP